MRRDVADLILFGSDEEIIAAGRDPDRKKVSAKEAIAAWSWLARECGISAADAIEAAGRVAKALREAGRGPLLTAAATSSNPPSNSGPRGAADTPVDVLRALAVQLPSVSTPALDASPRVEGGRGRRTAPEPGQSG